MLPAVKPQPELCALLHSMSRAGVIGWVLATPLKASRTPWLRSRCKGKWSMACVQRPDAHALPIHACEQGFRERLVRGEVTFAELASKESHCSSAQRGGDLGEFG